MPFDFAARFADGLRYADFLDRYATPDQRRRWDDFAASVQLTAAQSQLLSGWTRRMNVIVLAGAWCGDCINQCPMFERFAQACPHLDVRYFDRDAHPQLAAEMSICGGARVPSVVFLSEDGYVCGRAGDRTLSKYRTLVTAAGAACPTGLVGESSLTEQVLQDWLQEFERIQWMLRTSSRLRQLHGD